MTYDEYMCPFCVTPWKCNGPHIPEDDMPALRDWEADIRADEREQAAQRIEAITPDVPNVIWALIAAAAAARGEAQ